jgi:molybdopterin molybdotransferase
VLAAPLIATDDFPDTDRSAMDGFAFAGDGPWLLRTEAITAGSDPGQPLGCGEAVRIATGAMTRGRTTAVLRTEHAHVRGPLSFRVQTSLVPVATYVRARRTGRQARS